VTYWLVCAALLGFGYLAGFSIGLPFFYLGVALLILSPLRRWNGVFWPLLLAVIAFEVGYNAVAPFYCSATQAIGGLTTTVCTSLIGIRYEGGASFDPPRTMALGAGVTSAILTAFATWLVVHRHHIHLG
jgi:hypothetical protein